MMSIVPEGKSRRNPMVFHSDAYSGVTNSLNSLNLGISDSTKENISSNTDYI